jgi:protein involved in polysaccharide export with SLBB domain
VLVTGAVNSPGAYQYLPQRPASYYVRLAGGVNPDLNSGGRLKVRDSEGRRRHRKEPVQAGDRVYVRTNDFLYNFNRYFPVVSSGIALVTSILTLRTLVDLLGQ